MQKLKITIFSLFVLVANAVLAQTTQATTSVMKSNGKIYVVMAVAVTILLGLVAYVWHTDKKITSLENEISNKQ